MKKKEFGHLLMWQLNNFLSPHIVLNTCTALVWQICTAYRWLWEIKKKKKLKNKINVTCFVCCWLVFAFSDMQATDFLPAHVVLCQCGKEKERLAHNHRSDDFFARLHAIFRLETQNKTIYCLLM